MANILDFLRGVLTDPDTQAVYRADPDGFVVRSGFADLTGEDVVEAVGVLRRSLPPHVAGALTDFDDETRLPAVRPSFSERDLDAALRQLDHAVALVTGAATPAPVPGSAPPPPFWETAPAPAPTASEAAPAPPPVAPVETGAAPSDEPIGPPSEEPIEADAEPELVRPGLFSRPEPPPHPPTPAHHEPIAIEDEVEPAAAPEPALAVAPPAGPMSLPDAPSVDALGAAIEAAAAGARTALDAYVREVRDQLAVVLGAADRDATAMRAEAQADLDAARKVLLDARDEAARIRAEAEADRADVDARLAELREAERQLRERLTGLDDVFRTVLKEE